MVTRSAPALLEGPKAVTESPGDMFTWPIITQEDEEAVLEVLRRGGMSGSDVTRQFEQEYAAWQGADFALGMSSGTAALQSAMYGCDVGVGDEIICPSLTYWASALPCYSLGATVVFADVEPDTLCLDPNDIEWRIGERTRAIVVVHYLGYPADMDPIMAVARRHNLKVIEDVSHAHGGRYKGRQVGSIGDVAATSLMSGKALPTGEGGILTTNDRRIYERALAFGHYERYTAANVQTPELQPYVGLPLGGYKYRMHQLSAAVARVQLRHFDERMAEIQQAMNHFWDLLEGTPGLRAHRPPAGSRSTMGGWYSAHGLYRPEELGGLSVTRYAQAVRAEGAPCSPGVNKPLHLHPLFQEVDVYGDGKPTRIAHASRDVREARGSLPVSEAAGAHTYSIPWFKHHRPTVIERYAEAFRKPAEHAADLRAGDLGDSTDLGDWHFFAHR